MWVSVSESGSFSPASSRCFHLSTWAPQAQWLRIPQADFCLTLIRWGRAKSSWWPGDWTEIMWCEQGWWSQKKCCQMAQFHRSGHVKQLFYVVLLALCFSGSQQIPVIWRALWWGHKVGFNSNPDPESRFLLPASCLLQSGAETAGSAALSGEPCLPVPIVKLATC